MFSGIAIWNKVDFKGCNDTRDKHRHIIIKGSRQQSKQSMQQSKLPCTK